MSVFLHVFFAVGSLNVYVVTLVVSVIVCTVCVCTFTHRNSMTIGICLGCRWVGGWNKRDTAVWTKQRRDRKMEVRIDRKRERERY